MVNNIMIKVSNLDFYYGSFLALNRITVEIKARNVTALIGPSGCGKSTFLRCLNRMNDTIPDTEVKGEVIIDNIDIYQDEIDLTKLRQKVGMVFQKPNPFPQSIFNNVAYGPRRLGLVNSKKELSIVVESSLEKVGLWDEIKHKLYDNAMGLSLGQQQRLCIARLIAVKPDVILMDEPASALDPIATSTLEELIKNLREIYTIVIVTHNMQQAARVSDFTGMFWLGELVEFDNTAIIFTSPKHKLTEGYITGRMG